MNQFFDAFANKIDIYIVGLVLLSGFFQKKYFQGFKLNKKDDSYDSALKTLCLSAVVSVIYIILLKDPSKADNYAKYVISYFMATSLYELLVSKFVDWIKVKTGQSLPTDNQP